MSSFSTEYNLENNPFRLTPSNNPEEIIWAGFSDIYEKFEIRIKNSIRISNSTLVLNWGEYGSGKTHASRFFTKSTELERIAALANVPTIPYSFVMPLPKGKDPLYSCYISIIDKIDIEEVRAQIALLDIKEDLLDYINKISTNNHILKVVEAIYDNEIEVDLIKKYLYGNLTGTEINKSLRGKDILRNLKDDNDFIAVISLLFSSLTFDKRLYSCIILWIDEFEDITTYSNINIDKINKFFRELIDNVSDNLLMFLNLTQTALVTSEDLGHYLHESVKTRIKSRIEFKIPSRDEIKLYLVELLEKNRIVRNDKGEYFPFDVEVVDIVIGDLKNPSLRRFNEALSTLIELSQMDGKPLINSSVYNEYKEEIIW